MKTFLLYLSLSVLCSLASSDTKTEVFIQVLPNRSQFFQYEHVSLNCEVSAGVGQLRRNTTTGEIGACPSSLGTLKGSSCTINTMYPSDSGFYWCESSSEERSHTVHIVVTAGSVILESPALPVTEGDNVTLSCRSKTKILSNLKVDFSKDGLLIRSGVTEDMTLHSVSKSDEGLYKCQISGAGESAESWLVVGVSDSAVPDASAAPLSVSVLVSHVVVGIPYLMTTILLVLICRDKRRALQPPEWDKSHNVIMEMD